MTHLTKRFVSFALIGVLAFSLLSVPKAFAADTTAEPETVSAVTEDLGNGFTATTTISVEPSIARASTKKATISRDYKYNGDWIATISMTATFSYSSSSVSVTSATHSKSLASGWSFSNATIKKSGGTATLTGDLKKSVFDVPVSMSLTCSKTGEIS